MKSGLGKILETLKSLQAEMEVVRRTPTKSDSNCIGINILKSTK